jgi:hypothetical protein
MSDTDSLVATIRVERRGEGFIVVVSLSNPRTRAIGHYMPGLHPTRQDAWNAGVAEANRLMANVIETEDRKLRPAE